MKSLIGRCVTGALLGAGLCGSALAGDWHFPVGLSYSYGIQEATDKVFDLYEQAGFDVQDRFVFPVGVTFNPYYEFDFGLGLGVSVGPTAFIFLEENINGFTSEDKMSVIVPVGADVRYTFLRNKPVSPYVRVGVRYPITSGDFTDSSKPGPFGAVGVEFYRKNSVGFGVEVGYDASTIKVHGPTSEPNHEVTFSGFMVSVFALF